MLERLLALAATALILTVGAVFVADPALAGRSACPGTYVCTWNTAGWVGTMAAFQPSTVYAQTGHCLNFQNAAEQDAISSVASYNSAATLWFFRDINCSGAGNPNYYPIGPDQQVKDLKGTGWNDTFSSVYDPYCC